jgi:hypothetical protein
VNKTYRLIWSKRHSAYLAVSELVSPHGKDGGGTTAARPALAPTRVQQGRLCALKRLAGAVLLSCGFVGLAGAAPVLVTENPWGRTDDQTAMNAAYGINNWTLYTNYASATTNIGSIFNSSTRFVMLEGSANTDVDLSSFLSANSPTILNWVSNGGSLLLQSAGWGSSVHRCGIPVRTGGSFV